jgi:biopolymer transport protein ExbD
MRLPPTSDDFPEIPVVPLIDVMFTLLTFFIVTSLFIENNKAANLKLPDSATTKTLDFKQAKKVNVSVDKEGDFFFDKVPVNSKELLTKLTVMDEETVIILSGDEGTEYQDIVRVMDVIRSANKYDIKMAARQRR